LIDAYGRLGVLRGAHVARFGRPAVQGRGAD
jgi:hypothetical protein